MEGTMNNSQNKTMDEIICDLAEVVLGALNVSNNLRTLNEKEFAGDDGEDVTDKLPSMTEALKLRETMNEIKKIYEWDDEMNTDFIDSVKERERVFIKYYGDNEDIKEKYYELEEENKILKDNEKILEEKIFDLENIDSKIADERLDTIIKLEGDIEKLKEENGKMKEGYDCVEKQMDYEEECMKEMLEELPEVSNEDCMGCRFSRFRQFMDVMRITQRDRIKELEKQIPDKKNKKLSKNDKELLSEIDDRITWGDGDRWIERRKLLDRLLK